MRSVPFARCAAASTTIASVTAVLALLGGSACNPDSLPRSDDLRSGHQGLSIVVTIPVLAFIVREVAGDRGSVRSLLPPGASPHTFEPTIGDVRAVDAADLLISVGGGFDDWAVRFAETGMSSPKRDLRSMRILDLSGLRLLAAEHVHGRDEHHQPDELRHHQGPKRVPGAASDPHVWLDPVQVRDIIVPAVALRLARLDPTHAHAYHSRAADTVTMLTELDKSIRTELARAPRREYLAFHNGWRYFTARYDLREIGVIEEAAGEEPTPREIAALIRGARKAQASAILIEPQLGARMADTVAAEFGGTTVTVDPLGDPRAPERSGYRVLMEYNARAFARALGADQSAGDTRG